MDISTNSKPTIYRNVYENACHDSPVITVYQSPVRIMYDDFCSFRHIGVVQEKWTLNLPD